MFPVDYEYNTMRKIELYDLSNNGETTDVADKNPDVVKKIESISNKMRKKLGDKLYDVTGQENRPIGQVE